MMVKGFYFRLVVLFLFMFSLVLAVGILGLLPAYFFSSAKNNAVKKKLEIQKTEIVPTFDQETGAVIKDINKKLNLIETANKNTFPVSQKVLQAILSKKAPSIKITQISYDNSPQNGKRIRIGGTAPSREVLLSFRQSLEDDKNFKSVDLPISNFVKGSNIQFYLSLVPVS